PSITFYSATNLEVLRRDFSNASYDPASFAYDTVRDPFQNLSSCGCCSLRECDSAGGSPCGCRLRQNHHSEFENDFALRAQPRGRLIPADTSAAPDETPAYHAPGAAHECRPAVLQNLYRRDDG